MIMNACRSNADIVLSLLGPSHDVVDHLVEAVVLVVKSCILELKVLELFILLAAVCFEQIGQVVDPLADLFMQLVEFCFGAFLQFFELHLEFTLLLSLTLQ